MFLAQVFYKFVKSRGDFDYIRYEIVPLLLIILAKSFYYNHTNVDYQKETYGECQDQKVNFLYQACIFITTYVRLWQIFYVNYISFLCGVYWAAFFLGISMLLGQFDSDPIEDFMYILMNPIYKDRTPNEVFRFMYMQSVSAEGLKELPS